MEWVGSRNLVPALQGPVVDFRTFIGGRGIVLNYDLPGQPAGANAFGVQYQRIDLADAAGWTNVPASFSPAKQMSFTSQQRRSSHANGVWDVYIYDSTNDGDDQLRPRPDRPGRRRQERRRGRREPAAG